jgi:hypothetical protein
MLDRLVSGSNTHAVWWPGYIKSTPGGYGAQTQVALAPEHRSQSALDSPVGAGGSGHQGLFFRASVRYIVGNGPTVLFWSDPWLVV